MVKNLPAMQETQEMQVHLVREIPGSGISLREGNGNPFQYSCLGNPVDRGAWWATVHGGHRRVRHTLATITITILFSLE